MNGFYLIAAVLVIGASIALVPRGHATKGVGVILLILAVVTSLGGVLARAPIGLSLLDIIVLVVAILIALRLGYYGNEVLRHSEFPISSTE
ncbi:MAG: hypothetical protein ABI758_06180 [Candidatus Woesebacteria bacterium]